MIKLLAALTMLIDHIGLIFFPEAYFLRFIGRLSMPLFAYCLARGYEHSRMKRALPRYIIRLSVFAAVSQFPYRYMIGDWKTLNIGCTWLIAILILTAADYKRYKEPDGLGILFSKVAACLFAGAVALSLIKPEYGIYGILLPLVLHYGIVKKQDYFRTATLFIALWGVYTVFYGGSIVNGIGVLSLPIVAVLEHTRADGKVRLPKAFYYSFYPVHIIILLVINYYVKGA